MSNQKNGVYLQGRSQEGGGGNFKLVMIQSSHRFGLLLRRQICLNPVWLGGLRSPDSLGLRLATLALTAHPPNWIQTNFVGNSAADQTCTLD